MLLECGLQPRRETGPYDQEHEGKCFYINSMEDLFNSDVDDATPGARWATTE